MFIKEKEYSLGIDYNLRSRYFYLENVRSFCNTHGSTEKEDKNTPKDDTNKDLEQEAKVDRDGWRTVQTKGLLKHTICHHINK